MGWSLGTTPAPSLVIGSSLVLLFGVGGSNAPWANGGYATGTSGIDPFGEAARAFSPANCMPRAFIARGLSRRELPTSRGESGVASGPRRFVRQTWASHQSTACGEALTRCIGAAERWRGETDARGDNPERISTVRRHLGSQANTQPPRPHSTVRLSNRSRSQNRSTQVDGKQNHGSDGTSLAQIVHVVCTTRSS